MGDDDSAREAYLSYKRWIEPAHRARQSFRSASRNAGFFVAHLKPGMRVLDAGCGSGSITLGLAEAVTGDGVMGSAVGVDCRPETITSAREAAVARPDLDVRFEVADLYSLPFEDDTFDAVFSHGVVEHLLRPIEGLTEMRRVLRPGGLVGVVDGEIDSTVMWPQLPLLEKSMALTDTLMTMKSGWTYPDEGASDTRIGRRLRDLLGQAGFRDAVGSAQVICEGTRDATRMCAEREAQYLEAAPLIDYVTTLGLASHTELREMADAWRAWGEHEGAFMAKYSCEALAWI